MKKEDVDLYLSKINKAQTESERLFLTKEFFGLINKSVCVVDKKRMIDTYPGKKEIINYLVETGAVSLMNEIGAAFIPDLSRAAGAIIGKSNVPNKQEETKKIDSYVEKLLADPSILPENPTQEQIDIYDGLLTRAVFVSIEDKIPVNDTIITASQKLFNTLPDFRKTMLYQIQISRLMNEREDIRDLIPKLPADEYRDLIAHPTKSGKRMKLFDYDNIINEFLAFYGDTEEVSLEEKQNIFENITSRYPVGTLMDSSTYTKYFMGVVNNENAMVLYENQDILIKDVLARVYENDGNDIRTTDYEKEMFTMFFLPKEHDMSVEYPEHYEEMKAKFDDYNPRFTYDGILKEMLTSLFLHDGDNWVNIAKYMIRLKKIFNEKDRPNDEFLASVYDYAKSLDVFDELKANLDPKKLIEHDPIDMEETYKRLGWEYTDEQHRVSEEEKKWEKENNYDPNRTFSGLRRIDYADIALELMLEADYERALDEFRNPQNIESFRRYGKDLYNSRAIRKLVELYVTKPNSSAEIIIREFVNRVSLSPNFNIFNEQGVSELLQLGHLGMTKFGVDMISLVRNNLVKNPTYQMTTTEAAKNISDFINDVGDNTIDASKEAEFDKFLISLTKLKIYSKDGIMPEEAVDFLISQSMRTDSLINSKKDKYGKVPGRAIEDLGKIDNLRRNNVNYLNRMYIVRDYIDKDSTLGLHRGNVVTIKKEQIDKLSKGGLDAIDTVFHENTHMTQEYRLEGVVKDYAEYLMKKERLIRRLDINGEKYYDENYFQILTEIEAREVAARMTAKYVAKIAPKTQIAGIADSLKQDVVGSLLDRYKKEENRYRQIAEKEVAAYKPAINKIDSDGKNRTINQIFDRRFKKESWVLKNFIKSQPMAEYEYFNDGSKKSFSEQIRTVVTHSDDINYDFIKAIINYSGTAENADTINTLGALNTLLTTVQGNNSKRGKFVSEIVGPNLPNIIDKHIKSTQDVLKAGNNVTIAVDAYIGMKGLLNRINSNQNANWVQGFKIPNDKGNDSVHLMNKYCTMMKDYFPNIDNYVSKLELQQKQDELEKAKRREQLRRKTGKYFGYKQVAAVRADIKGKDAVAMYEKSLMNIEQNRTTEEIKN